MTNRNRKWNAIEDLLVNLEELLYGHNYQVTLGINELGIVPDLIGAKKRIKETYIDSDPDENEIILISVQGFWESILFGFSYRGDDGAGLELSETDEIELALLQSDYLNLLGSFLTNSSAIYSYQSDKGIPGYPVFWDYKFVIINKDEKSYFVYGSSSD